MSDEERQASEMMRDGSYFEQSRQWFAALYIAPISERSFFLVISIFAAAIALVGFLALAGFLPIVSKPPIVISNPRIDDAVPVLTRMRQADQDVNAGMREFYLKRYVQAREGYTAATFETNRQFVAQYSDKPTLAIYEAASGADNPRNPQALLGTYGRRDVEITSVQVQPSPDSHIPSTASIRFSTTLGGIGTPSKTQWTATIGYYYSDAVVSEARDPQTGDMQAKLQEPTFQVVNYVVAPR